MSKSAYQCQVDEIVDHFDFAKVRRCMEFLNWQWAFKDELGGKCYRIPTNSELCCCARQLLDGNEGKESWWAETGGFRASVFRGRPSLAFMVEEWSADDLPIESEGKREKGTAP